MSYSRGGFERFVAVSCTHGDRIDKKAARAFFKFIAEFKPKHRIHVGDLWDFRNLRRGADPKEEGDDMAPDWFAGLSFLNEMRPTALLLGNHDWRLWKAAEDSRGLVRHYAQERIQEIEARCAKLRCQIFPYDSRKGIYRLGNTSFLHGYHAGVNATRQHAAIYGASIFGHLHRTEEARVPRLESAKSLCIGTLADFKLMDYAAQRTATLAWEQAFCFGAVHRQTGEVVSWIARRAGEKWLLPSGLESF